MMDIFMQEFFQLIADKGNCDKNALESIFNNVVARCKKELEETQSTPQPPQPLQPAELKKIDSPPPVENFKPVILPDPVIYFDSKLGDIMMHADKPIDEIIHAYEQIITTTPTLNVGDKIRYSNGKHQCKGTISQIIKDSAILSNVYDSNIKANSYTKATKYMFKLGH
jgi:hypothetical protein